MHALIPIVLLCFYLLTLYGATLFVGKIAVRYLLRTHLPESYRLILGFAMFPVLISYAGFAGLGLVLYLCTIVAVALGGYGAWHLLAVIRRARKARISRDAVLLYAVPVIVIAAVAVTKFWYLYGGLGGKTEDEFWRLLMTSSLASNGLKPAFPLDFSLPVVYPYLLFETSAFLYVAVNGLLFPSIPQLAMELFTIALIYVTLYAICTVVFRSRVREKFFIAALLLTCSGFTGLLQAFDVRTSAYLRLYPVSELFQSGYHYLWGVLLGGLGICMLWKYIEERKTHQWSLWILCMALCFGFSAISFLWIVPGAIFVILYWLARERDDALECIVKNIPLSLGLGLLVGLPLAFNLIPRSGPTFSFSLPHMWYVRDAGAFATELGGFPLAEFLAGPSYILVNNGPFAVLGFGMGIVMTAMVCFRKHKDREWTALSPLCFALAGAALLLTYTEAPSGDWWNHGMHGVTVFSMIVAAKALHPLLFKRTYTLIRVFCIGLVALQGTSFFLELAQGFSYPPPERIAEFNTYPLGTIFYSPLHGDDVDAAIMAGRAAIVAQPVPVILGRLNRTDIIHDWVGSELYFTPCQKTAYGESTPQGLFLAYRDGVLQYVSCEDVEMNGGSAAPSL